MGVTSNGAETSATPAGVATQSASAAAANGTKYFVPRSAAVLDAGRRLCRARERRVGARDRHHLVSLAHLAQQIVLPARARDQGRGEDHVEERTRQAHATDLLGDDGELDGAEPLAAVSRRDDEAEVAHLGELPPLGSLEAARRRAP